VLHAARAGKIVKVAVAENQQVAQGTLVAALE
jgi:multidrug efflux pump subunit AcrA (membrane-fusion protein)